EIYTLSLHDALPIYLAAPSAGSAQGCQPRPSLLPRGQRIFSLAVRQGNDSHARQRRGWESRVACRRRRQPDPNPRYDVLLGLDWLGLFARDRVAWLCSVEGRTQDAVAGARRRAGI